MGFREIIGQSAAIQSLKNTVQQNRLGHTYLFYGTAGVGKETTALAFAKWLNCANRTTDDSCGHCASCRKISSYNHIDVKLIFPRPASMKPEEIQELVQQKAAHPDIPIRFEQNVSIVVDDIREMQQQMAYPPYEAKTRVVIIREVEKLSVVTANALLKTLEEPPERTLLILTSNQIHVLLQTILSRCQKVRFRNLQPDEIEQTLMARYKVEPDSARLLAHLANGSLGDVIGLESESLLAQRQEGLALLESLLQNDSLSLLARAEEWAKLKQMLDRQLQVLILFYRDLMLLNSDAQPERYMTNLDLQEKLRALVEHFSFPTIEQSLVEIDDVRQNLARNVNAQLALLQLFFRLRQLL